jgi:hypothetical protein
MGHRQKITESVWSVWSFGLLKNGHEAMGDRQWAKKTDKARNAFLAVIELVPFEQKEKCETCVTKQGIH